jgi:hypothetical protein
LTGLGAIAVLRATMLPTVGTWDTAEAQVIGPTLGTMHPTGFPAYVVLGWLTTAVLRPLGSPAFLMNLLSVLLVGAAVAGSVLVARRLEAPLPVAVAVGTGFALTPIVWGIGTAADVHALHIALVVAVTLGLLRWASLVDRWRMDPADGGARRTADRAIVLTAGVFGVAVANHALALLLVPAIGLYVLAVEPGVLRRPRLIAAALGVSLGVAALLYLELPLRAGPFRAPLVYGHPETWSGFWSIVLASQFQGDVVGPFGDLGGKLAGLADIATSQFGPLAVLVPAGLLVTAVRFPRYALLSFAATLVTCLFAASYVNARIDRYYLGPAFFAWTWIGVLATTVVDRIAGRPERDALDTVAPPRADPGPTPGRLTPRSAVALAMAAVLVVPTGVALRDRWTAADRSQETWVARWLDEALSTIEPDAVVVSWWSYSTPLWYAQIVEGRRPDIWIVDDRTRLDLDLGEVEDVIDANLGRRPVYVMRVTASDIQNLGQRFKIEPAGQPGNLYLVTGRQETNP